ncbi:MAG: hypothetical protein KAI93_16205, partial [Desulfobacterales bacterium]|nr:hypothetical protein [Desulfobacterales bacterium]
MGNANSEDFKQNASANYNGSAEKEKTDRNIQIKSKVKTILLFSIAGFIFIILMGLVVRTSVYNRDKYYLKSAAGAVELWQGTFSPGGKKRILIMPGVHIPQKIKEVYA